MSCNEWKILWKIEKTQQLFYFCHNDIIYDISENKRFVSIIEELKTITINFASTNKY